MLRPRLTLLLGLVALVALARLLPHPPNFSPVTALALFGGAYFASRYLALGVTLTAMLLSDWLIGFHPLMWAVYLSFAAVVMLGSWLREHRQSALPLAFAALGGSLLFFLLTNFAHWLMFADYPHTLAGLLACYVAALPFFQNALAGDLLFTAVLFGGMALIEQRLPRFREPAAI
jgi:hypothetical protein